MDSEDVELQMELEDVLGRMAKKLNARKMRAGSVLSSKSHSVIAGSQQLTQRPGYLTPQPKDRLDKLIQASQDAAPNHFMSSTGLQSSLQMLQEHMMVSSYVSFSYPEMCSKIEQSEACGHMWIDAFMYRAIAMSSPGKHLLLNLEYPVVSTDVSATSGEETIGGVIDYVVMLADKVDQNFWQLSRAIESMTGGNPMPTSPFVVEAKVPSHEVVSHVPQAIGEMLACARCLKRNIIRGALTNGRVWVFLILHWRDGVAGALYRVSVPIKLLETNRDTDQETADLIAGILSYWIEHAFEDIGEDDWFRIAKRQSQ